MPAEFCLEAFILISFRIFLCVNFTSCCHRFPLPQFLRWRRKISLSADRKGIAISEGTDGLLLSAQGPMAFDRSNSRQKVRAALSATRIGLAAGKSHDGAQRNSRECHGEKCSDVVETQNLASLRSRHGRLLRCAWSQPVATVVCGMTNRQRLEENVQAARDFKPPSKEEEAEILEKARPVAQDGRFEPFKSTTQFDGVFGKQQHGPA
jgi:hypothetical protein